MSTGFRNYSCAPSPGAENGCSCLYDSPLAQQCEIQGTAVLDQYGYEKGSTGKWIGIMLGIIAGYVSSPIPPRTTLGCRLTQILQRFLGWVVLYLRKQ